MKGYIYSMETFGTVDGPGIRFVLFMQGCPLRCKYCHNRDTWDMASGKVVTVDGIMTEVAKYRDFYLNSGGGVTASGGEPTMQPEFVTELFRRSRELGLNTALDTSGFVEVNKVRQLLELTDLVLLDIKHMEPTPHKELTGVAHDSILEFARHLSNINKPVWIRQVLIPGINNGEEQLAELAGFLKQLPNIKKVELLGYHKLGTHKWETAGCTDPLTETPAADLEEVEQAKEFLRRQGVVNI